MMTNKIKSKHYKHMDALTTKIVNVIPDGEPLTNVAAACAVIAANAVYDCEGDQRTKEKVLETMFKLMREVANGG
jgi:hypothetical protein